MRAAYPAALTGRAMVIFLGVATMQWLTGIIVSVARGADPFTAVLASIAALAFVLLPGPAPRT